MSPVADTLFLERCLERVRSLEPIGCEGRIRSAVGLVIEAEGIRARVGSLCRVEPGHGARPFVAEVVGFREGRFALMPLGAANGVEPGARVRPIRRAATVPCGESCLGRVIDGLGRPIDGGLPLDAADEVPLERPPEPALGRRRIRRPLDLGVRAMNALLTAGEGTRLGLFAGSGVGKSTLLGQIARHTRADVNVVGLVGERGREVREFVERDLGPALERSVVVVATGDEAPLLRVRAARVATAIADDFRRRGLRVLLLMDSLTRVCMAQREIGIAAGEPPSTRGYPPSAWALLPNLLERAGTGRCAGSVTGIYTVLVEGDDTNEPVADTARSLLDGHVVLSRQLAERGQFPAIDVLASVSRLMPEVASPEHRELAQRAREALATHRGAEDLIAIGAYREGSDPRIDRARRLIGPLRAFLAQDGDEGATLEASIDALRRTLAGAPSSETEAA